MILQKEVFINDIVSILQMTMDSGISMVRGALLARGIIVQRQRVIDAMHRVDPISQCLRRTVTIYRRQYSVPGPNSLWYITFTSVMCNM